MKVKSELRIRNEGLVHKNGGIKYHSRRACEFYLTHVRIGMLEL